VSGHSKWSSIKHKKAAVDAKRGQIFTKLAREIMMAARKGGADPAMNAGLRLAVQRARDSNMPNDNVQRAIERGAGAGDGDSLEEITYEGYGPGGTAVMIQALTDNRNRTVADIRAVLSRNGGNLGETGVVSWQFDLRGVITVPAEGVDPDAVQLAAIEAGALDVSADDDAVEVITEPSDIEGIREALTAAGFTVVQAEVSQVPRLLVSLDEKAAIQALKLLERLEDLEDVSRVYTNADFSAEVLEAAGLAG